MRPGGGVFANGQSTRSSRCCTCANVIRYGASASSGGCWYGSVAGALSESTVGRIVARLVRLGRVEPVSFYYGQVKPKRRRTFTHHAKRWRYGMKAKAPGELMQADHMSVSFTEGACVKEFKATCPVSKWSGLQVYSRATSRNAKRFLAYLKAQAPFPIRSLQVDGGSEFRDEFEQACQASGIPLYVLPPKKPEYNGCVERANGTSRYEFYPYRRGAADRGRHQSETGSVSDLLQYVPSS